VFIRFDSQPWSSRIFCLRPAHTRKKKLSTRTCTVYYTLVPMSSLSCGVLTFMWCPRFHVVSSLSCGVLAFMWCPRFHVVSSLSCGVLAFMWCPRFHVVSWLSYGYSLVYKDITKHGNITSMCACHAKTGKHGNEAIGAKVQ
jgi:hypothetical protein